MIAPWINPPNYLQAIQAGASLGAQLRQQRAQEEERAQRLRLSFAENALRQQARQDAIAAQQAEMEMKRQQQMEANALRQNQFAEEMMLSREKMNLDNQFRKDNLESTALDRTSDNARQTARDAEQVRHNKAIEGGQGLNRYTSIHNPGFGAISFDRQTGEFKVGMEFPKSTKADVSLLNSTLRGLQNQAKDDTLPAHVRSAAKVDHAKLLERSLKMIQNSDAQSKEITADIAKEFVRQARGDRELARKLAREAGYSF